MESGALAEFGGLQKKVERGEWLTLTPGWLDRPAPKEEVCQKSGVHGIGSGPISEGGVRYLVLNNRVDLQLRIVEILREMTTAARSENLHCFLATDGRKICLRFHKGRLCKFLLGLTCARAGT